MKLLHHQASNALLVRDYLARRDAASRERLEGHMAHMMRIWEGLYQRLGLLVLVSRAGDRGGGDSDPCLTSRGLVGGRDVGAQLAHCLPVPAG